tara:strand:- start:3 stop:692 length:690 start_codon:yes stop_codon:yes gene_type:complete
MIREARRTQNSKQDKIQVVKSQPSVNSLREGQEAIYIAKSNRLERYRKEKGRLWVSYMDTDNNYTVNKDLNVGGNLDVKGHILGIQYHFIIHNFTDNLNTDKHYLPWSTSSEGSDMNSAQRSLLTPFKMTLNKLYFRPETLDDGTANFTFGLDKQDDGDATVDSIATFPYEATLSSDTMITVNKSDWNNTPTIEAGKKAGLFVQASSDPDASGAIDYYVTSVWEVEILN